MRKNFSNKKKKNKFNFLGYTCINLTLKQFGISINRSIRQKTFIDLGINKVFEIIETNLFGLFEILKWNIKNNIYFYRMSSSMFPLMHLYNLTILDQNFRLSNLLNEIGDFINRHSIRVTFHPGPYISLSSDNQKVVETSIYELENHSWIMNNLKQPNSVYSKINIHIGGLCGRTKNNVIDNFKTNFTKLSETTKSRLTLENDDNPSLFSIADLLPLSYDTGIPLVFDYLHHKLNPANLTEEQALKAAVKTWHNTGIIPIVHLSSSTLFPSRKHSDYLLYEFNTYGLKLDGMIEAKMKEKALLDYRARFNND